MVLGSWCVEQFKGAGGHPDDVGYMPFPITVGGKRAAYSNGQYAYAINKMQVLITRLHLCYMLNGL